MPQITFFNFHLPAWVVIPVFYFSWVVILLTVKRVVFVVVKRFTRRTKTHLDDVIIDALSLPVNLLIFVTGGLVIEKLLPLFAEYAEPTHYFVNIFKGALIVSAVLFADKLQVGLVKHYSSRVEILQSSGMIVRGIIRLVIFGLGALILLDSFGVSITPIIASLGIGSLAVALALQPTLENFFAGVQIVMDQPVKLGHFVKLDSGEEGYVYHIGWRSTWIRLPPNNMVIIPNNILVNSKITNYHYPDTSCSVVIQLGVHYSSDLQKVERVTEEVARNIQQTVSGAVKDFVPDVRYVSFDASSINFAVALRAEEFSHSGLIKHEFVKRLQVAYQTENITIPYPVQAINLEQEQAFAGEDFLRKFAKER